MFDDLLHRLKSHYLDALLLGTRITDSVGGALVVYYAHLTLRMAEPTLGRFIVACAVVVVIAILLSLVFAYWETRHLRSALKTLFEGRAPDQATLIKAGEEAVVFPARHHWTESWLVPSTTLVPVLIYLGCFEHVPFDTLTNVTLAALMGTGLALMATFFVIERGMQPLVRYLLDRGATIDFKRLPSNHLKNRLNVCFGLVILITALMIGTLANQRAADIIRQPENQKAAVEGLRTHTGYITLAAIIVGFVFSSTISSSVASRVAHLVQAMKKVEQGQFGVELRATGNDEIDVLTRQFNSMVQQLAQHDATIRDLNANLERKVDDRTMNLRLLHAELDQRNNDLETAMADLKRAQSQLVEVAHRAGMTEIATGVLHNVGNVLNSVNVSVDVLNDNLRRSKISGIAKIAALMREHAVSFAAAGLDKKLQQLPNYVTMLAESLTAEQEQAKTEMQSLTEKVQHIKNIISAQHMYTRRVSFREEVDLHAMINDSLAMHGPSIAKHSIQLQRQLQPLPTFLIEKSKLLQVIDNVIKNAVESMASSDQLPRVLTVEAKREYGNAVISVTDTGHGIRDEHLKNIFRFGFTTKPEGNGFGLHSAALAMNDMGGSIRAASDGWGHGATFILALPLTTDAQHENAPPLANVNVLSATGASASQGEHAHGALS
jgi:signal transduction histidine kinase